MALFASANPIVFARIGVWHGAEEWLKVGSTSLSAFLVAVIWRAQALTLAAAARARKAEWLNGAAGVLSIITGRYW
jgi:hypothetical protein